MRKKYRFIKLNIPDRQRRGDVIGHFRNLDRTARPVAAGVFIVSSQGNGTRLLFSVYRLCEIDLCAVLDLLFGEIKVEIHADVGIVAAHPGLADDRRAVP